ncbi:hypothetical protein K0M31_016200 [Melipona bicolor]|uniref:Uncharacterized protein n=1 Tax=Melipona bicolor TaxID=60889 RepID=A0AA40G6N0_9HYME|nr:hypothetical protein K0M31_016200 [Melipona bicolor]
MRECEGSTKRTLKRKKKTKRKEKEKAKSIRKKKVKTKVDETRAILVCGHNRCLQPTIMIIAPGPESC